MRRARDAAVPGAAAALAELERDGGRSAVARAIVLRLGADMAAQIRTETRLLVAALPRLISLHRSERMSDRDARAALDAVFAAPARPVPLESLVGSVWSLALERRLSAYDACYVVLAETLDAPLVTADRQLAAATPNAVLITS